MITIQYLEDSPALAHLEINQVVAKLHESIESLPISHLLMGWNVPSHLLEACKKEAEDSGIRFLRWHPLLTSDSGFTPHPKWQIIGLSGHPVPGYRKMPEFTFVCPNHPEVQEAVYQRLSRLIEEKMYQGFFLDRIRFPSPASDPIENLGCFCAHCQKKASSFGIDLDQVKTTLLQNLKDEQGIISVLREMLGEKNRTGDGPHHELLRSFLDFRIQSVVDFIAPLTHLLRENRMEIGLDCFSPSLTKMVGQDLAKLSSFADWIKIMSYAHAMGPAGIPFELSGLHDFLIHHTSLNETEAMDVIRKAVSLPLPLIRRELEVDGLSPQALAMEVSRGVRTGKVPVLAGIELVEIEGVISLTDAQIMEALFAVKKANSGGLALSWDLWHIPVERLSLVKRIYFNN